MNDEVAYALYLILSVAVGHWIQGFSSYNLRKITCGLLGFVSSIIFCKLDFLYAFVSSIISSYICTSSFPFFKKYRRIVSFIWGFGFLTFFRTSTFFGFNQPVPLSNAIQLVLTLKIIGLAGEVSDSEDREVRAKKSEDSNDLSLEILYRNVSPTYLDSMCYLFSYVGIFTGPYYTYRTWHDAMIKSVEKCSNNACSISNYRKQTIKSLTLQTVVCTVIYIVLMKYFPSQYFWSLEWSMSGFLFRFLYLIPVFTWFRLRFYSAWLASETALTSLNIGIYPSISQPEPGAGPKKLSVLNQFFEEQNFAPSTSCNCSGESCTFWSNSTVHNIDIYDCELSPTISGKLRAWNRSVQYWLAVNVHQRTRSFPKSARAFITVFVSAYWHGLHGGYYLSFGTAGALLSAEKVFPQLIALWTKMFPQSAPKTPEKEISDSGLKKAKSFLWTYILGFWSMRAFEYMAVGFYVLAYSDTLRIWSDIMYYQHIIAVFLIFTSFLVPSEKTVKN